MKYFSEKLNKLFDSEKECSKAEAEHEKQLAETEAKQKALADERASRAKNVEDLYKQAIDAKAAYDKELRAFLKDYGSFHCTLRNVDPFFNIFSWF